VKASRRIAAIAREAKAFVARAAMRLTSVDRQCDARHSSARRGVLELHDPRQTLLSPMETPMTIIFLTIACAALLSPLLYWEARHAEVQP